LVVKLDDSAERDIRGKRAGQNGTGRVAAQLKANLELENAPTMRMEGLQTMSDGALAWLGMAMTATVAAAQTTIQTSGAISAGPRRSSDRYRNRS
jgi:hypothetical protein